MKKWSIVPVIVAVVLCMSVFTSNASAQTPVEQDSDSILLYRSEIVSDEMPGFDGFILSDNATMTKSEVLKNAGVPGKGIDGAPGLQKFFNSVSKAMERIRRGFQVRFQEYLLVGSSDNVTATDNITMTRAEILKNSGVPGKGIDQAPGLQKPFNPSSNAVSMKNRNQERIQEKNKVNTGQSDNVSMNKADILKQNGVQGEGIEKAPGLQKQFNPESNASNRNR